jgi:hypothetical protein
MVEQGPCGFVLCVNFAPASGSKCYSFHVHSYVREVFCPREGLAEDALKERLRLVDAAVGNIQVSIRRIKY